MARLTIFTHDEQRFDLEVADAQLHARDIPGAGEWFDFSGLDGRRLIVHSKNVASVWLEPGSKEQA